MPFARIWINLDLDHFTANEPCLHGIVAAGVIDLVDVEAVFEQERPLHVAMVFEAINQV